MAAERTDSGLPRRFFASVAVAAAFALAAALFVGGWVYAVVQYAWPVLAALALLALLCWAVRCFRAGFNVQIAMTPILRALLMVRLALTLASVSLLAVMLVAWPLGLAFTPVLLRAFIVLGVGSFLVSLLGNCLFNVSAAVQGRSASTRSTPYWRTGRKSKLARAAGPDAKGSPSPGSP